MTRILRAPFDDDPIEQFDMFAFEESGGHQRFVFTTAQWPDPLGCDVGEVIQDGHDGEG